MRASPELLLISSVLRNKDITLAIKHGINRRMFHVYPEEWGWIEDFFLKRSTTPSRAAFQAKFPQIQLKAADDTIYFTEEVRDEHKKRSIVRVCGDILNQVKSGDSDFALNHMFSSAMSISNDLGLVQDGDVFRDYEDIAKDFAIRRERFLAMGASGVPTGFETFDERTGGFAPGEFWVVAARLGQSKSYNLIKMAVHAALAGYKIQYDALEMTRANVMARVIPLVSPRIGARMFTSQSLIRGHDYDPVEFQEFMFELKNKVKGNLHISDARVSTTDVASQLERNKPDIAYIDHITLMPRKSQDWQGVEQVADELDALSKTHDMPIVGAAQLNRTGVANGAAALAGSDKIGQNASGIILLEKPSRHVIKYAVEKARNHEGNFGWWSKFDPDRGIFQEISYDIAQELIEQDQAREEENK